MIRVLPDVVHAMRSDCAARPLAGYVTPRSCIASPIYGTLLGWLGPGALLHSCQQWQWICALGYCTFVLQAYNRKQEEEGSSQ